MNKYLENKRGYIILQQKGGNDVCQKLGCKCQSSRDCICKLQFIVDHNEHISFIHENNGLFVESALLSILGKLHEPLIKQIACGSFHSLALLNDGTIITWGRNCDREPMNTVPDDVQGRVIKIAGSDFFSVALLNDNSICVWNDNERHMISDFGDRIVTQITTGPRKLVVLLDDGSLREWYLDSSRVKEYRVTLDLSNTRFPKAKIIQIGSETDLSMGLLDNGTIKIWKLIHRANGEYVRQYFDYPPRMHVPEHVRQIACGSRHSIALLEDDRIFGWGDDSMDRVSATRAFRRRKETDIKQIACGGTYSLVLFNNGSVEVLARGAHMSIPVAMARLIRGNVVQIACGFSHALVLLNDGTVAGWYCDERMRVHISVIPDKIRAF